MAATTPVRRAILLVNLGTPEAPTPTAVRRYLRQFLSDPRVVEIPRAIWWLILNAIILPFRSAKSARAYVSIWTPQGSPLLVLTRRLAAALERRLGEHRASTRVEVAMTYGRPSVSERVAALLAQGIERIVILPLYPQYSGTSTAPVFDALARHLLRQRVLPELVFIRDYHDHPAYIDALAGHIQEFWRQHGRGKFLLMSFHGLPERNCELGDPYRRQCETSARLLAERLGLAECEWRLVFQSRFGRAEWLKPYCVDTLAALPGEGVLEVDVVCPGFAVDCLETLEEIAIANREIFLEAGGTAYRMIPALNDSPEHADALLAVLQERAAPL